MKDIVQRLRWSGTSSAREAADFLVVLKARLEEIDETQSLHRAQTIARELLEELK